MASTKRVDTLADVFYRHAHRLGHFFLAGLIVRTNSWRGGIEQTHVDGLAVHGAEDAKEVSLLVGKDLLESLFATFNGFR